MNLPPILASADDLSVATPDGRMLINHLSFVVKRGGMVVISGPNGSGKSTLLRVILGEIKPKAGNSYVHAASVSYLSQIHNRAFHIPLLLSDILKFSQPGAINRNLVTEIGLLNDQEMNLAWNTASGGERQKALVTQALLKKADLLVLDEPMNHLDTITRERLIKYLLRMVEDGSHGVLMVCHEKMLWEWQGAPITQINLTGPSPG